MRPDEFLWYRVLRHGAELIQEGTLLKVNVQAIAEARVCFADEGRLVDSERELNLASTLFEAGERCLSNFLGEPEGEEG